MADKKTAGARFRTKLMKASGNATGFVVPEEIVAKLGGGKRAPVKVTINGFTYQGTLAVMGGRTLLGVSAERRAAARVKAGDMLDVTLTLDTAPREIEMPAALVQALAKDKKAKAAFEALATSYRKEHARSIADAKSEETRERRIAKVLAALRGG